MPSRRWNGTLSMPRNTRRLHLFFPALPILPASKSNLPTPTLPQGLPGQENRLPASPRLKSNRRARSKVGRQQEERQTVPWDSDYLRRDELRWYKGTEQVRWFKSVLKAPQQRRWAACGNTHTCTCYKHPHKEQWQIFVLSNRDHDFFGVLNWDFVQSELQFLWRPPEAPSQRAGLSAFIQTGFLLILLNHYLFMLEKYLFILLCLIVSLYWR